MIIKDMTGTMTMTMTGDVTNLKDDETIRIMTETVVKTGTIEEIRLPVIETIEEIRLPATEMIEEIRLLVTEMIEKTKLLETEITIKGERGTQTTIRMIE
jgi:hypothetical protein